ncbi:MAG: twin-arginine translocation signal domain-containing protein [Holophaga sp.]|nr:twin-arginine translocation signal domain-containing protein [Holophaga sp.]
MSQDHLKEDKEPDPYTEQVLQSGLSRRSFLARAAGGAAAAGLFGLSGAPANPPRPLDPDSTQH